MRRECVIGVDVGGTTAKGVVVEAECGTVIDSASRETTGCSALEEILVLCEELRESAASAGYAVLGVGVVTPGIVNEATGVVEYATNLKWKNVALRAALEERLEIPVRIGHDVRAAGLAESRLGVAQGLDDFIMVPLGTGIAAAVMTGGVMVTGSGAAAGEFGHMPVYPHGEQCACGQLGCLETYASAASIARRYEHRAGGQLSAEEIIARLSDDEHAAAVWNEAVEALAFGLASLVVMLDPALVVLGGGLSNAGPALTEPVHAKLTELLTWREAPPVVASEFGAGGGQVGAVMLAFEAAGTQANVHGMTTLQAAA